MTHHQLRIKKQNELYTDKHNISTTGFVTLMCMLMVMINPADLGNELLLAIKVKVQGVVDCLL